MKCPKCQSDIKEGARFCSKCGFNLQNTQPNPDVKQDVPESAVLPESRLNKHKKTDEFIILIVVLLIAGIGTGAWFVLHKSSEPVYQEVLTTADRYFNKLDYVMAEDYYLQSQQLDPKQKEPYIKLYEIYQITEEPDKAASIQNLAYENLEADDYSDALEQMNQIDLNLALNADAENQEETEAEDEKIESEDAVIEETVEGESQAKDSVSDLDQINARARKAYQNQMQSIYSTKKAGDYTLDFDPIIGKEVDGDQFMIADVTGDGVAELIFYHYGPIMSANRCFIYSYDPDLGECFQIMSGSAFSLPYDNGWLEIQASHNQSGYTFWPISMDQYDASAREYRVVFNAEGADPQSSSQDINGNGEVVWITFMDGSPDLYMDDSEFDTWFGDYINHGTQVNLDNLQYATLENIQAIAD